MFWRKFLAFVTVAAFVATASLAFMSSAREALPGKEERAKMMSMFLNCVDAPGSGGVAKIVQGCVSSTYSKAKTTEENQMILDTIVAAAKKNQRVRSACHDVLHEMGSDAWLSFKQEALVGTDVSCGMGYYHGAMREVLRTSGNQRADLDALRLFCERLSSSPENSGTDVRSLCYHGIGHALGGVADEFDEGKNVCDGVAARDTEERRICVGGFLNEYLQTNDDNVVSPAAAETRCEDYENTNLLVECIMFSIKYGNISSEVTAEHCRTLVKGPYAEGCWSAVGMIHGSLELFDEKGVEGSDLVNDPARFASHIEKTCDGDATTKCSTNLVALSSQSLLNPAAMILVCANMVDPKARSACEMQVNNLAGTQKID